LARLFFPDSVKAQDEEFPLGSVSCFDLALRFPQVPVLQMETVTRWARAWETFSFVLILSQAWDWQMELARFSFSGKRSAKDLAWPSLSSVSDVFAMALASALARGTS
jgi:hypothetical protein